MSEVRTERFDVKEEKRKHTGALLSALEAGTKIPLDTRLAFGLCTAAHEQALVKAIADQRLTASELDTLCLDGRALTDRVGSKVSASLPLTFRTEDDFYRKHMADDGLVRVDEKNELSTTHGSFIMRVSNVIERMRADTLFSKEPETVEWLDSTIGDDSVLYDIGANVGIYTLYAAHMNPSVQVVAFEPEPLNYARLSQNVHANPEFADRVISYPLALHDSRGVSRFFSSTFATGKAENWTGRDDRDESWAAHCVGCVMVSLDEFVGMAGELPRPTHLKIDVDGPELNILKGAAECLRAPELAHVLVELGDRDAAVAEELLAQFGFRKEARSVHFNYRDEPYGNVIFAKR